MIYGANARMALDTIERRPTAGIPTGLVHIMEHGVIERLADVYPGSYVNDPHGVYLKMQKNIGACLSEQYLALNPLSMGDRGYDSGEHNNKGTNTGGRAVLDGMEILDADDAAEHIEKYLLPRLVKNVEDFNEHETIQQIINDESAIQTMIGPDILKAPDGRVDMPHLMYGAYGYEPFFTAYLFYPELMERVFALQADHAALNNAAFVKAVNRAGLPKYARIGHDMADSRGLLCSPASLEKVWVDHFIRSIKPLADDDFTILWHCDGNLMELVPYLLEAGINGFQGFQYEDGMDYIEICKLKPKRGGDLVIQAGVSVTRTLPFGKPADVVKEIDFLVGHGTPHTFLSLSSSCVPGTPYENIKTCIDGMNYYRLNGRKR